MTGYLERAFICRSGPARSKDRNPRQGRCHHENGKQISYYLWHLAAVSGAGRFPQMDLRTSSLWPLFRPRSRQAGAFRMAGIWPTLARRPRRQPSWANREPRTAGLFTLLEMAGVLSISRVVRRMGRSDVEVTDPRNQPCELTADYESELPAGIGHEGPKRATQVRKGLERDLSVPAFGRSIQESRV